MAHLKPITAPSAAKTDIMRPSWAMAAGLTPQDEAQPEAAAAALVAAPQEPPASSGDFTRDWKRNCTTPDDKYRCGPAPAAAFALFLVYVDFHWRC